MALTEKCPACGAPMEVSDVEGSTFRCGFCSTELRMEDIGGELHLTVAGKPSPQSEVLSDKAHEVLSEEENSFARVFGDVESDDVERDLPRNIRAESEAERDIYVASFQGEAMPEPPGVGDAGQVAPGYTTQASSMADVNDWIPENRSTIPENPVTIPETSPYQAGQVPAAAGRSNTNRWIAISLAVFVGICIMCACVVGAFMAITNGANF